MSAIRQLYFNADLVTIDGYIKVRDGLWVASGPYQEQTWRKADKSSILPTKKELHEIYLKLQELIQIQESCGLDSLRQILEDVCPLVWTSEEETPWHSFFQDLRTSERLSGAQSVPLFVVPVKRIF